jgi:hypothetical protein
VEVQESVNVVAIRGVCSSPAEVRVLPSEQVLAQLQVTTRVDGKGVSVPVAVLDPASWVEELDAGDEVIVVGHVKRRFYRASGTTASRVEIAADYVAKGGDRRRRQRARRRVESELEALES